MYEIKKCDEQFAPLPIEEHQLDNTQECFTLLEGLRIKNITIPRCIVLKDKFNFTHHRTNAIIRFARNSVPKIKLKKYNHHNLPNHCNFKFFFKTYLIWEEWKNLFFFTQVGGAPSPALKLCFGQV